MAQQRRAHSAGRRLKRSHRRRLLAYPLGKAQAATHLSLYLDSSPEALDNPVETSFMLILHGHDGAPDVVNGAPLRAATRHVASDAPARRRWDAQVCVRVLLVREHLHGPPYVALHAQLTRSRARA